MLKFLKYLLTLFILQPAIADQSPTIDATASNPTSFIKGKFSATGDQYWQEISLILTNTGSNRIDLQGSIITFENLTDLNTNFWGDFHDLAYPINTKITSQKNGDRYIATIRLTFPTYSGSKTTVSPGKSITIKYGSKSKSYVAETLKVYLKGNIPTVGNLELANASSRPMNVTQDNVKVNITQNSATIATINLPWHTTVNQNNLPAGIYHITADPITDIQGNVYNATVNPSIVTVFAGQTAKSTITYSITTQTGKVAIKLGTLPSQISSYTNPTVTLIDSETSTYTKTTVPWGQTTTVSSLRNGATYSFTTNDISANGYLCKPTFTPATVVANATTAPITTLSYNCIQAIANVTLKVTGLPSNMTTVKVIFKPNNGTSNITHTVNLTNGAGSIDINLTTGIAYTVEAEAVTGYSVNYNPQPLFPTNNVVETITYTKVTNGTPVAVNGKLKVCGNQLCNQYGTPIQLKGMSTHGIQWYGWGKCLTTSSLDVLANDFKASVIRLSMYIQEGGYETDPVQFTNQMNLLINEATKRGLYVIVDWHMLEPGDPNYNLDRAKKFFTDIATTHKDKNNLLYEIANEPSGVTWQKIKSYANQLIPVIRAINPDTPIIIGTVGWSSLGISEGRNSQDIINDPITFPNVMYTFHFYAASHGEEYFQELDKASKVLPIFVTEFGTQTYTGDGENNFTMSTRYLNLMAERKISWTNWNYSDDFRSGAIWKEGTCSNGNWVDANLKPAGIYIKDKIRN